VDSNPPPAVPSCPYDEDYYLRGKESGKSLYENYRWLPELTLPMVDRMVEVLGIRKGQTVLDFGCARGYTVRAFLERGYDAWGVDYSQWAIDNADPKARHKLWQGQWPWFKVDWIIAKDVLEHIHDATLGRTIENLLEHARVGVFVVVPLAIEDGCTYVVPEYEKDVTHVQRLTLETWVAKFSALGWSVNGTHRIPGIKDNYAWAVRGNGFITARRIER
jgi:2-polyprenyl-3-methyl-5-hydroxy-6-metoxy-1,4-benzoquinol methylase